MTEIKSTIMFIWMLFLPISFTSSITLENCQSGVFSTKEKIAFMFNKNDSLEAKVLKLAYDKYLDDSERGLITDGRDRQLEPIKVIVSKDDMYNLSSQLCRIANCSVTAIFSGSADIPIPAIIQSYAGTFQIPHLTFQTGISELNKAFELQPRFEKAISELIAHLGWKMMAVVFDNFNAMQRLQNFMGGAQVVNTKYVFDNASIETALREMKLSKQNNVLLFLSKNLTELFFRKAEGKEMLTQQYHYVIADLRMPCRKVQFNITGKINITCFKLLEDTDKMSNQLMQMWKRAYGPESMSVFEEHQLEVSLAYDAFLVLRDILKHDDLKMEKRQGGEAVMPCLNYINDVAAHKTNIGNLLYKVKLNGVTGNIQFNEMGLRRNYQLQILDVGFMQVHSRIANWSDQTGLMFEDTDGPEGENKLRPSPNHMRVTTVLSEPFVMVKQTTKDDKINCQEIYSEPSRRQELGMDCMEGFLIDLIREIMKPQPNVTYDIKFVKDGGYGAMSENGTWNGMIGELLRGEADVALAPLTINSGRQQVVDFTKPYMTLGISIMMREPSPKKIGLFSFLGPLTNEIWMCCLLAYVSVSVVLFLVSRFSAGGSDTIDPSCAENEGASEEQSTFGIINCLWFSLGSFMQQGGDICPNSLPGRIVASSWWFFTLIIISSYTANLAAFLTADRMKTPIKGAEDLAAQTAIEYGVLGSGSSRGFFEKSSVGTYQRMYAFMKDRDLFTLTTMDGVRRVRDEKDNFAFLMESIMMEYYNQQLPCNTYQVGGKLNTITYGLATPKDSPFLNTLTIQILELIEFNVIEKLKKDWWYNTSPCNKQKDTKQPSGASRLTIDRVMGVFVLLSVAVTVGVVVALGDTLLISFKQSLKWKLPFKRCMGANVRMALKGNYIPPSRLGVSGSGGGGGGFGGEDERLNQNFTPLSHSNYSSSIPVAESTQNLYTQGYSNNNGFGGQYGSPDGSVVGVHLRHVPQNATGSKSEPLTGYPLLRGFHFSIEEFQPPTSSRVHTNV
ncbi:glutamate receptor 1-like isoform X2 [Convolutriloba macropyga]|uniref:glutamate receptor 1-like isoform X2 n=1 Tax=Convolutriloba macropyga TaxID=536237 RepID=UPI003F51CD24